MIAGGGFEVIRKKDGSVNLCFYDSEGCMTEIFLTFQQRHDLFLSIDPEVVD